MVSVTPRPVIYPRERTGTHCIGGWVGPRAGLDGRKISPHRDSIPGPFTKYMLLEKSDFGKQTFTTDITKLNSVALVRERTIPTERPPPVGEVSANFCG